MKKRIMILGAGVYQVPLIKKAKEMGLETVVVSPKGNYPGILLADIWLDVDTTDANRVLDAARQYAVSGVVTTGTDVSVPTVGVVVDALGLRGPTKHMADTVSSKTAFRAFLKEHALNCPDFVVCHCARDAWGFYKRQNDKMVIKPDDSSGSRGVMILDCGQTEESVIDAYRNAVKFSRSGRVCAEAFIEGVEVGGDAFFVDGEVRFLTITRKHMDSVIVQGHSLPGSLSAAEMARVKDEIQHVASKLGYDNGAVNFDVMINAHDVTILELGLRNGGNGILDLVYHSEGVNLAEWLLAYTLGDSIPEGGHEAHSVSSYVFGVPHKGCLKSVTNLEQLTEAVPEVFDRVMAHKPGDHVEPFIHNANLVGYLLLRCGAEDYESVVARVRNVLKVEVDA